MTVRDVCVYFQKMSTFEKSLLSQAVVLLKLLIVMPATNAFSSFLGDLKII